MSYSMDVTPQLLWQGAMLGTIAHAIWIAYHPEFAHEQVWDGRTYNVSNSMGALGTVAFRGGEAVGVFFDAHSSRSPYITGEAEPPETRLQGMPEALASLADEALQYVLQEYEGEVRPLITTAFWSEQEQLAASEPWTNVMEHGAHLIEIQLRGEEEALSRWREHYAFSTEQMNLLKALFERRMHGDHVRLRDTERQVLFSRGTAGAEESSALLASIGLEVPAP